MENKDRRNLLFLSVVIIINYYVGITIDSINILGNTAKIDNPQALEIIVFLIWGYFLFRYYQHILSTDDLSIKEEFISRLNKYSRPKIIKEMQSHDIDISDDVRFQSFSDLEKESGLKYAYTLYEQDGYGDFVPKEKQILRFRIFIVPILISVITFILNSKCFSEYFIPIITASVSLIFILLTIFT